MTTMRAAIYARKSTDQQVSDEAKSVTRQILRATEYAVAHGWTVEDQHVYVDDGVSGAEFERREGFTRFMAALRPRPAFQVVVMMESSRLGREAIQTAAALQQIVAAGVRVFYYLDDREETLLSALDKMMLFLRSHVDESERERSRTRTYDALLQKAKAGHVTGGRLFGYENMDVAGQNGKRSHVERRILEAEAAVVRRIFELSADGRGYSAITKLLNAEAAPSPRAQLGRPRAWAPSSVREVLYRTSYRGEIRWSQTRKRDTWGKVKQAERPKAEWVTVPAPHLRIVSDALWAAAHARLRAAEALYLQTTGGVRHGRPSPDVESKYLLTGLARCGDCGGSMYVKKRKVGTERVHVYGCTSYHRRGSSVCRNRLEIPITLADRGILAALLRDIVNPDVLAKVVAAAMRKASGRSDTAGRETRLSEQIAGKEREMNRLITAITMAGDVPALADAVRGRQQERDALQAELASLRRPAVDMTALRKALEARAMEWQAMLGEGVPQARAVLRKLLGTSPIVFTARQADKVRGYAFRIDVPAGNFLHRSTVPGGDATPVATLTSQGFLEIPFRRAA